MSEWLFVIGFILFGLGLVVIEIIFVPGTTVIGILGFLIAAYGVFESFISFGSGTGITTLVITVVSGIALLILAFKSNMWEKFALKGTISSKVKSGDHEILNIGQKGITISTIKPFGKAIFFDKEFEVTSQGNYIAEDTRVRILKLEGNKIYVEPITD